MRRMIVAALVCCAASPLAGQVDDANAFLSSTVRTRWYDTVGIARGHGPTIPWKISGRSSEYAPIASAIIPGAGQVMLGNDRFIGYVAIEVLSWWKYAKDVGERRDQEAEFKSLARRQARAPFSTQPAELLPDADWSYYEKMRDFSESGAFSLTTVGPIVPETLTTTFNGARWKLAQSTFTTREAALEAYMREAIRPEFSWSWKGAQFQYDIFKRTTNKRNDAYHAGVTDLMVIGANHVLSMVDAFSTIRLRAGSEANGNTIIGARIPW
jgi:hypothetical protein